MIGTGQRRPRNEISRRPAMAMRAADLLDEGQIDREVAEILSAEFGRKIQRRTVAAFRNGDYRKVAEERRARQDASNEVRLVLASAKEAGADFTQGAMDLLAKMIFDTVSKARSKPDESIDVVGVGKLVAKFQEVYTARLKAETDHARVLQAAAIKKAAVELTPAQLVERVDEIMGLKRS